MAVHKVTESKSTDAAELRMLHNNLEDQLHQAYMTASEMIMYCKDDEVEAYEAEAERILETKYRMKDLARQI